MAEPQTFKKVQHPPAALLKKIPMPNEMPRLRHQKLPVPASAHQLFQHQIAALHIIQRNMHPIRILLCPLGVFFLIAVTQPDIYNIQIGIMIKIHMKQFFLADTLIFPLAILEHLFK